MKKLILLVLILLPSLGWAENEGTIDIRDKMTMREFTEAGLDKLSSEEIEALNKWLNNFTGTTVTEGVSEGEKERAEEGKEEKKGFLGSLFSGVEYTLYKIRKIESDRRFKIEKHYFTSTSVCPGYVEGDDVIFTEGRADGMCENAEFSRPDGSDVCEVFCR